MFELEQLTLLPTDADHSESPQQNRSRRRLPEPFPSDPLGQQLCGLFPYRWQAIVAPTPTDVNQKPSWKTITNYPIRPRSLWNLWQDAAYLVGVRFGATTRYAMLDLDAYSPYHPGKATESLQTIRAALETVGLYRSLILRSSWSGGLHLYIPLPEAIPTFDLAVVLKHSLEQHGFAIRAGQLEIFPNVKRFTSDGQFSEYNAHRLPLQPAAGSVLLNDDLQPIGSSLARFFQMWDMAAAGQNLEELKQAIAPARKAHRSRPPSGNNVIVSWQQDLLDEIEQGWTGRGQTNHLLKAIACYGVVFQAMKGDALVDYVVKTATECPGYLEWCQHQHEINQRARDWAIAAEGYYWPLGTNPKRTGKIHEAESNNIVPFNRQRSEDAQERIRQAIAQLQNEGRFPEGITARMKAIAPVAKCSFSTLKKYKMLWYPQETVTACPEPEPDDLVETVEASAESPNSPPEAELHTNGYMKGLSLEFGLPFEKLPLDRIGEGAGRGELTFPQAVLDEIMTRIQAQIQWLGWSVSEVQQFIAERFGGRRRSQLSDDELILLLYGLLET